MKNKKVLLIVGAVVLLGAMFIGAMTVYKNQEAERLSDVADAETQKFVPEYAPKMGPTDAEVSLVEFLDPECESCREFYPYVKMIMKDYEGRVQLVVRYAPFHGNSRFVIKILEASRKQGKYWETLELLFQHQPEWGSHHHPQPELIWNYLPQVGLDIDKIKADMNDPEIDSMIAKEIADGETLGVRGTPTFFVNGKQLEEFSYNALRTLVESSLKN